MASASSDNSPENTETRSAMWHDSLEPGAHQAGAELRVVELVVLWSRDEPERVGEVLIPTRRHEGLPVFFGRGTGIEQPGQLCFVRRRPGTLEARGVPSSKDLSRNQLEIFVPEPTRSQHMPPAKGIGMAPHGSVPAMLDVRNVGRPRMLHNGHAVTQADVCVGDFLEIDRQLLLICLERPVLPRWPKALVYPAFPFGEADPFGIVGESPAAWQLRKEIALKAMTGGHLLILGPTGSGKTDVARAVHGLSPRRKGPFEVRDIKAIPATFVAFELFGNAKGVPNGNAEREGIVARAAGGSLVLDEIGDISVSDAQSLRRFLDCGEYMRMGDTGSRTVDVRVIGSTNRLPYDMPTDVQARFPARLTIPPLSQRVEDIPLIAAHLLRVMGRENSSLVERFFGGTHTKYPRMTAALVQRLLDCGNVLENVRAIDACLRSSVDISLAQEGIRRLQPPINIPQEARPSGSEHPVPGEQPAAQISRSSPFTPRQHDLLLKLRRNHFSTTACARDSGVPEANQKTWDRYYNELLCQALVVSRMHVETAVALVEGKPSEPDSRVRQKLLHFIQTQTNNLLSHGLDRQKASILAVYRSHHAEPVLQVLQAILEGRLDRGKTDR